MTLSRPTDKNIPALPDTSYSHIWALSWPVMVSTMTVPLVGAVDVAMMGHLPDPAYVGGVGLGSLIFGAIVAQVCFMMWCWMDAFVSWTIFHS